MQNNYRIFRLNTLKFLLIFFVISIPFSRALLSISGFLILLLSISFFDKKCLFSNKYYVCLIITTAICLADVIRAEDIKLWANEVFIKLTLLILPLPFILVKEIFENKFIKYILIVFVATVTLSSTISVVNYFINFEELNKLVLQSKNIPIAGGMHHITFSVYCALAVFVSFFAAIYFKTKWLFIFTVLNIINLHILSARTGLAGFYIASLAIAFMATLRNRKLLKYSLPAILVLILLPIVAFFSLKSFQNRIINSIDDLKTTINNTDANYKSMAMRVEATKTAFSIFKKNPIFGVGTGNLRKQMDKEYEIKNTNLFIENRILPHNQFVLEAATHGIVGLIPLFAFVFLPFLSGFKNLPYTFISLWILLFIGFFFECFFERQHGVVLISFFWFILYNLKTQELNKP